jgi:hypothetical protein
VSGLAIGRILFRALSIDEVVWAVVIAVCLSIAAQSGPVFVLAWSEPDPLGLATHPALQAGSM